VHSSGQQKSNPTTADLFSSIDEVESQFKFERQVTKTLRNQTQENSDQQLKAINK
jgi:hypothetical protein